MTVGLPGAGVGGIFYLLSALSMPAHAIIRQVLRTQRPGYYADDPPRWGLVWRQFATALGIIAGLWLTGWALASYLIAHPQALGAFQTAAIGRRLPNVLKVGAVIVSLITLFSVFGVVFLGRLVTDSGVSPTRTASDRAATGKRAASIALLLLSALTPVRIESQVTGGSAQDRIATADRAWSDGDTALARREYEAALAIDPFASRALYRLGELNRASPRVSREFFRRYTEAEPGDAWGWIALGNVYARERRIADALATYDSAERLAPGERDVRIGRARVLAAAGRTDAAIIRYESWISGHPQDAEALRELGDERRRAGRYREAARAYAAAAAESPVPQTLSRMRDARSQAAPRIELNATGTRDSDENDSKRVGAAVSAGATARVRFIAAGSRRWISGPVNFEPSELTVDDVSAGIESRPLASLRVEAKGGVSIPRGDLVADDSPIATGIVRSTWRQPGGGGALDLRATRMLLDVTPLLVINRVTRTELGGRADIPIMRRLKLRAGARTASYSSTVDDNTRISLLGGAAIQATRSAEVSGMFQRITFSRRSLAGYFSPRSASIAEAGTYAELENNSGLVIAIDAGAGAVRLTEFGAPPGDWEPSYRLFASLTAPVRPGSALHLELDTYDSRLAETATTSNWRFISLTAALSLAIQ